MDAEAMKAGTVFRQGRAWHVDWKAGDRVQVSPVTRDGAEVETSVRVALRVFAQADVLVIGGGA